MLQLKNSRIVITGGDSMIGRAVARLLERYQPKEIRSISHKEFNLLNKDDCDKAIAYSDFCFHCAGYNGNIAFNALFPADIFYETSLLAMNVLNSCIKQGVTKVVSPLASCAYPDTDILKEEELWNGKPNNSVDAHGLSKRNILAYSIQLFKQYGFESVSCIFNTAYGPYDSYDESKTKVVGSLIKKFVKAKESNDEKVICWGTGKPRREIIYCDDAAQALINTLIYYDNPEIPLNIGTGEDISIFELSNMIAEIVGYKGEIVWDTSKPDGQYRKLLNVERYLKSDLPMIDFLTPKEGLTKTIKWYYENIYNSTLS